MKRDSHATDKRHGPRLRALGAVVALSLGSLALAGCGEEDSELQPADPPMEEPAQQPPMDDEPGMGDPGGDPGMEQDPGAASEPMEPDPVDPMESQEPMEDDLEDEEPGNF